MNRRKQTLEHDGYIAFKHLIGIMPGHVYWLNRDGVYLGCNLKHAIHANLHSPDEIIGKTNADLPWKDDAERIDAINTKIMETGEAQSIEEINITPDGKKEIYLSEKKPLIDENGETIGLLGVSFDITKQKEAEQKVIEANESKSRFLAAVDRLIRNPLSAIVGTTQLLQQKQLMADEQEMVDIIARSAERITPLLDRVQYYLDLEEGSLKPIKETFQLAEFFKRHVSKYQKEAQKRSLAFGFNYDDALPGWVEGSAHFIAQALDVLLRNALRYTARGKISISVSEIERHNYKIRLSIVVRDTGQGIHPDAQMVLFHLFDYIDYRADQGFLDAGLNLSITAKMLVLIGGSITVKSDLKEGSVFTVCVPLDVVEKPSYRQHRASYHYTPPKPPVLKRDLKDRIRVLSVEDDTVVQHAFKLMLTKLYDCEIDQVYNLQEAYKALVNGYDIIFLDMNLPDGTGIEFLKFLEKHPSDSRPPVIVVTAFSKEEDITEIIEAGAQDVIVKPVNMSVLKDVVLAYVFEAQEDDESLE